VSFYKSKINLLIISHKIDLKIGHYIIYNPYPIVIVLSKMAHAYSASSSASASAASKPVVVKVNEWQTSANKYMAPKLNDKGGKSINLISKQTNRSLHISTPLMMTWGIADFVDEKGESDGKYSISLNFPNTEYATAGTNDFLQKLKDFENQILDDAVANSEIWWGEEMSREVAKHTFFPFLKYSKNKDTKKVDLSKPPSIRAKVPFYNGKWAVEIYDTKLNTLFPCENAHLTPVDFVPKLSNVACVLQCGGIWIGGKGWGLTWKLIQCIVKPREVVSVYGKCHIQLSSEELDCIDQQVIPEEESFGQDETVQSASATSTMVEDSDEEEEAVVAAPATVPVQVATVPVPVPVVAAKKVIVKKSEVAAAPAPTVFAAPAPVETATESAGAGEAKTVIKKKIIKKA